MKNSILMTCAIAGLLLAAVGPSHAAPMRDGLYPQLGEAVYLTDSCPCGETTRIFRVILDEATLEARLVEIGQTGEFLQVDCAGVRINDEEKRLYLVSKYGGGTGDGRLGYLNLETGTFHNPDGSDADADDATGHVYVRLDSTTGPLVEHLVLGAFWNNTFYVASQNWGATPNQLFRLDVTTGVATSLGEIKVNADDSVVLQGADIAFTADGRMFLWTNAAGPNAPKGLYEVFLGSVVEGKYIGFGLPNPGMSITGLAFRSNGFFQGDPAQGELAMSTCCDHVVVLDLKGDPAQIIPPTTVYDMCDCGGSGYDYTFGDMSNGSLGFFPCVGTIGYWKNHPWQYVDGLDTTVTLCGQTIDPDYGKDLLTSATNGNFSMLTAQLIAAKLNTGGGAGLVIISEAEAFLCAKIGGNWSMPFESKTQKADANAYKDALDAFNNGSAISRHCD